MDRANVRARRWAKNNPDKMAVVYAANRCRRASQIAASGGHFTAYQWKALKKQHGYRCLACGRKSPEIRLVADHVKPVCKGGTNDIGNIQPLCAWCNNSKHDDDADYRNGPFAVIRP
jgi:5-methylcytosine-specific restriction endonuclease McrA